ncbi:hypothetical protein LQ318_04855 [Aliifodinibius salicampi]|uniref:6-bladed beta-propeller protein n=1 Tax=Fodinibius salicampi TaxID=1920655 RepID=A0ABT3PWQ2_9BACT|nr:hypothetical protein [Fodinibius salicampi]MCW9712231.1 hypothetical protein [Fodinibius salicampi]
MRLFGIFLFVGITIKSGICQELKEVYSYHENIYTPSAFYVLGEDTILTVELGNRDAVLSLHDIKNKQVIATRRGGRGPGELSQNGLKYISKMGKDSIWVWDEGQQKGMIFDDKLNYLTDVVAKDHGIGTALIVNDTTVIAKKAFDGDNVVALYPLEGNRIGGKALFSINSGDFKSLLPITENPLLNQGPMFADRDAAYMGFYFGSTVLALSAEGKVDTISTPYNLPFPIVDYDKGYMAPDHGKSPEATLDISTDDDHIYILFSGKKFDVGPFRQLVNGITGKLAEEIEKSDNTREVLVIDKKSKKYIGSLDLPVMSKRIFVHGNSLYTLSYGDKRYSIIKYKMR